MTFVSEREAVVQLGERHEPLVKRNVVARIGTVDPEATIHVDEEPRRVTGGRIPIDPDRYPGDESPAGALRGVRAGSADQPQAGADDRTSGARAEVLLAHRRNADVSEAPRADGEVDAATVAKELDAQRSRADAADGNADPDPVAGAGARNLSLDTHRVSEESEGYREDCDLLDLHASGLVSAVGKGGRQSIGRPRRAVYASGWLGAWLIGLVGGCAAPDGPGGRRATLPREVTEWLEPDSVTRALIHPGVTYHYVWAPGGPWAIHLVQADLSASCDLALSVLRADARVRGGVGRERVSDMMARVGEPAIAAVNADFFTPEGNAVGAEIVEGQVVSVADRPTFAWRAGSAPWIGIATESAESVHVGWSVARDRGDGATMAVGGFPDLIDGGVRVADLEVESRPTFAAVRHPRTAVAYDSERGTLWLVVVDGRQMPYSAGMTLPELAQLFEVLGADEALNLDGGGSSALVLRDVPVNRPSDATGERAVVNALALVKDPGQCGRGAQASNPS